MKTMLSQHMLNAINKLNTLPNAWVGCKLLNRKDSRKLKVNEKKAYKLVLYEGLGALPPRYQKNFLKSRL